jgi:hypothetical protein
MDVREQFTTRIIRFTKYNGVTVLHSTIVDNAKEGILGGDPLVVNSIVYANGRGSGLSQIDDHVATASNCNIEDGYPGTGNIDVEPGFITPSFWALADTYISLSEQSEQARVNRLFLFFRCRLSRMPWSRPVGHLWQPMVAITAKRFYR